MPSSKDKSPKLATFVALMRGINVGGKNMLPMKDLVTLFLDAGCAEARTYIQSGNVIFRASLAVANRLPGRIQKSVADRFGLRIPVVTRTADELRRVTVTNPFLEERVDPATLHVAFLSDSPTAARVAALDADRSLTDRFAVRGREIYLHTPNGLARTKLTNLYFDSKLSTTCTVRNWNTVLKLLELAGG
jgi:uncharacterized protein (DUF1697 family)